MPWAADMDITHARLDRVVEQMDALSEATVKLSEKLTDMHGELRSHIQDEAPIAPAVQELVTVWKGSKIMLPFVAGLVTFLLSIFGGVNTVLTWFKDHVK